MFFYPVHQSLGQITGTMLYALEKTKTQNYIGIFFMFISILIAYLLLAPKKAIIPGFGLGASGLALKMVICQIISVNISSYFVSRYIKIPFDWYHQLIVLLILPMGFLSKSLSQAILQLVFSESSNMLNITISGLVYFFFSKEHKGAIGTISKVGIYFLMIKFGASFGFAVMGRISLLIGRFEDLINYSAYNYNYATPIIIVVMIISLAIWSLKQKDNTENYKG